MRVLLVPNPMNPRSVDASRELVEYLRSAGYEPVMIAEDVERSGVDALPVERAVIGSLELVVALGGDGTILKAVHILGRLDVPILGVNLGRLGFLSGARSEDLLEALSCALAGDVSIERRQTIEATIVAGGREAGTYRALNEVFVGRRATSRSIELEIDVNGSVIGRYLCDGVIAATPTGSTAYALSAGGPVVAPGVRGIVTVPVAPHTVGTRPLVIAPGDVLTLRCPVATRADACVVVDGDPLPCRTTLDNVNIRVSDQDVRLVRADGCGFYEALGATFFGV